MIQRQRRNLLAASAAISANVPALANLAAIHREFDFDWYQTRTTGAQAWVENRIIDAVAAYTRYEDENGEPAPEADRVFARLSNYYDMLGDIKPPPQDPNDDGTASSDSDGD